MPAPDHLSSEDLPTQGRLVGREHQLGLRVYFEDTDLSGVAYHANYLRWMERGRSEMLRQVGIEQQATHAAGEGAYAVSALAIRYLAPARLDDALVVATRLIEVRPASARVHQRVMRSGSVVAEADVTVVFVAPSGRPRRQPRAWMEAFGQLVWEGADRVTDFPEGLPEDLNAQ